jgi:outer membrane lipoprotein SlyB
MNRMLRQSLATAAACLLVAGAAAQAPCGDCGVVQSMRLVEQQGQASGVGMVAGGVLGGVLGHQIGSGRGNTVATIAGAGAGAYAGNQIEKNRNKKTYWSVAIKMDNGTVRNFTYTNKPAVHEGEHVKLVDGGRRLALLAN